jgi:hypothetical protein
MKLFIKRVVLFLIPVFIFILIWEIYLRQISTTYTVKEKGLVAAEDSIQLLILGNSHEAYDIDPSQFNLYAYNLAQVNQSIYFDKRLTLKYIDKLPHLKFVLIGLDFHSLYFSSQGVRDSWSYYSHGIEYKNELSFFSKFFRLNGYTLKVAVNFLEKDLSKKYKKINAIDALNGVKLSEPITKGWFSFEGRDNDFKQTQVYTQRANEFNDEVKNSNEKADIINDLEDFLYQLKSKNITAILFTPPCYGPFIQMLDQTQLNKNKLDIINLAKKFNIQYWDYLNLLLNETDFHDTDHLNDSGAIKFSKLVNSRLENL